MAETTKGKKRPSKAKTVLQVWARMQDPNMSHEEFLKEVHFVERNSPQWRRRKRRSNAEIAHAKVLEVEILRGFLERSRRLQDALLDPPMPTFVSDAIM